MNEKQHAPGVQGRRAGAFYEVFHKGNIYHLRNSEFRVFSLLVCGGMWSTFEIAERLSIPDPRSTIRYLRNMGIDVSDVWVREKVRDSILKFKRYFIHGAV
jgi:hypothetical protein